MKTIYLTRHAKSSWDNAGLDDIDRPLNSRGLRDAPKMGKKLKLLDITLDIIFSSTARRAIHTSQLVASELEFDLERIRYDRNLYHVGGNELLNYMKELNEGNNQVMIVGHNPGMTNCANLIIKSPNNMIDYIPTSGIVAINLNIAMWKDIATKSGELHFFEFPKNLS